VWAFATLPDASLSRLISRIEVNSYPEGKRLFNYPKVGRCHRPISVYCPGEMAIQSCGQNISAPRVKAGAGLNAHTELRTKRQRSAPEVISEIGLFGTRVESAWLQRLKLKYD
jgi:hypothetical protein